MENPLLSPEMWKECLSFLWLKGTPQGEAGLQPSCWDPIPEAWPLEAKSKGARAMVCAAGGITEGSLKEDGTHTMVPNTRLLTKPEFGCNHTENTEDISLLPFSFCPQNRYSRKGSRRGKERESKGSIELPSHVRSFGPDCACLGTVAG